MVKNWFYVTAVVCAVMAGSVLAQEPQPSQPANGDIVKMLRARVPESVILSEIDVLVGRGSSFDISPAALIELQQSGASEKVMNTVVWAQTTVVPGVAVPMPKGVFYRIGTNAMPLNSFLLWAEFNPRWATWPFYGGEGKQMALNASPGVVQVSESTPELFVQGFGVDASWQLVKMGRGPGYREVSLKTKHAFSKDFFSDAVFERRNLRPITFAAASTGSLAVRPAAALEPGDYALCAQLPGGGGWMRSCYAFQVPGM